MRVLQLSRADSTKSILRHRPAGCWNHRDVHRSALRAASREQFRKRCHKRCRKRRRSAGSPDGGMNVLMAPDDGTGACGSPAASYSSETVQPPTSPTGPAPTYSQWIDTTKTGSIFVNTGRDPLKCYNYLFAAQLGQVGFQKVSPEPAGCSGAN